MVRVAPGRSAGAREREVVVEGAEMGAQRFFGEKRGAEEGGGGGANSGANVVADLERSGFSPERAGGGGRRGEEVAGARPEEEGRAEEEAGPEEGARPEEEATAASRRSAARFWHSLLVQSSQWCEAW